MRSQVSQWRCRFKLSALLKCLARIQDVAIIAKDRVWKLLYGKKTKSCRNRAKTFTKPTFFKVEAKPDFRCHQTQILICYSKSHLHTTTLIFWRETCFKHFHFSSVSVWILESASYYFSLKYWHFSTLRKVFRKCHISFPI